MNQFEPRGTNLADILLPSLNTHLFGRRNIFHYPVIGSTNNCAEDLAASGAPEGTVVVADCQLYGRGQYGRSWYSPSGKGMYFSLILRPKSPPEHSSGITLLTAVSLAQTVKTLSDAPAQIKWPNDILIHGKKLAGILTEMSAARDAVEYIIVGVGINVGHQKEDFPPEISDRATSILMECGKTIPREIILGSFLKLFEQDYDLFSSSGLAPIVTMWKDLSDIVGRKVRVSVKAESFVGTVLDLDPSGFLIVEDTAGIHRRVLSGDITLTSQSVEP